jgi:hypothetical protein
MIDQCIDDGYDAEKPSVFEQLTPVANREHECYECGNTIQPGERYNRESGVWDGSWEHFKICKICVAVRGDFFDSYQYGNLWESMREVHGLGYDEILESGEDK